jgi:hypothetical protein
VNIEEYADVLNLDMEITRYPNQSNRYSASFSNCEIKEDAGDGFLTSAYGNGTTPWLAIEDYVDKIRGKVLVINAGGPERRQYVVPKALSAGDD